MDVMVKSHLTGILFYCAPKKLQQIIQQYTPCLWMTEQLLCCSKQLRCPTALWSTGKKNDAAWRRIVYQLRQRQCSRLKQNTLLIEGFKPGASPCLFIKKDNWQVCQQVGQISTWYNVFDCNLTFFARGNLFYRNLKKG